MNIAQQIITNILNEKASIDWNNYLTKDEVKKFLSKDDKVESAEEIVYNTKGNFYNKYFKDFKKSGWTKRELTQDLADFYYNGHLNEDYVLRGLQNGKSYDLAYDKSKSKLEKFRDEVVGNKVDTTWIEDVKLDEAVDKLWQSQIDNKSKEELEIYIDKLYKQLSRFNDTNNEVRSRGFYDLLDKINYIENILETKPKIGRVLK